MSGTREGVLIAAAMPEALRKRVLRAVEGAQPDVSAGRALIQAIAKLHASNVLTVSDASWLTRGGIHVLPQIAEDRGLQPHEVAEQLAKGRVDGAEAIDAILAIIEPGADS